MNLLARRHAPLRSVVLLCCFAFANLAHSANLTWSGAGDGFTWGDADNWLDSLTMMAPSLPPGIGDDVAIGSMSEVEVNNPAGVNVLMVSGAKLTVNDVLTIADDSEIDRLVLDGNIDNSGELKIQGVSEWKNGQLLGGGDVVLEGELTVDGGTTRLISGKSFRNVGEAIVGTQISLENSTWHNEGYLTLSATIAQQGANGPQLINTGTIEAGVPIFGDISIPLINNGGTLFADDLNTLNIDRRAEVNWGLLHADGQISFGGPDDHLFTGEVSTSGEGQVDLTKDSEVTGTLTNGLTGSFATLSIEDRLYGSGMLVNNGNLRWEAGDLELAGGVTNNSITLLEGGVKTLKTTFTNNLSTTHLTGSLNIAAGEEWVNEASSQYALAQATGPSIAIQGDGAFTNRGRLVKSATNTVNISSLSSHESAMIDVDEGELRFNGQSTHSGSGAYTVAADAKLVFNDQTHTFSGQTQVTGQGTLENHGPSQLVVGPTSSLAVATSVWQISGDMMVDLGEISVGSGTFATWIDSTIDLNGGDFVNDGGLNIDVGSSRTLSGNGFLTNQGTVIQSRALNLSGSGGGIANQSGHLWEQGSNITFENGSSGKSIQNRGTWRATSHATIFDPGGILANNMFEHTGALEIDSGIELTIHTRFNAENATVTLDDGIAPPPPSFIEETLLSLTGGGEFTSTPVTLGSNARLDLTGTGGTKTYLFDGAGASITGHMDGNSVFRFGPGARISANSLSLNVKGDIFNTAVYGGAVLDGGELVAGSFENKALFTWRSGEIAADVTNASSATTAIEGSSAHVLKGSFHNMGSGFTSGIVVQNGPLSLEDAGAVMNPGVWFMQRGANISSSSQATGTFSNTGLVWVHPNDDGGPHVVSINAPFTNTGVVSVYAGDATSSTLNLTANSGVVLLGELLEGAWITGPKGFINFPEPLLGIRPGASVSGNTNAITSLSSLELLEGELNVNSGDFTEQLQVAGVLRFGKIKFESDEDLPAGKLNLPQGFETQPGSKTESAVDQAEGVVVPAIVAPFCSGGCPLPTVAIEVGTSQFTNGGLLLPGSRDDPGAFPLIGDFVQLSTGVIQVDLAGLMPVVEHDVSLIYGAATLGGTLDVRLMGLDDEVFSPSFGDTFTVLDTRDGITGQFSQVLLQELEGGLGWQVGYTSHAVTLEVMLPGDFNDDGTVNLADYTTWRNHLGAPAGTLPGDNTGTAIGAAHYELWKSNFGSSIAAGSVATAAIPEPSSWWMLLIAVLMAGRVRQDSRQ